jgi:hypothetical protein|tara:strand:- start:655 stop:837 length:183 start_codon:yes stop_codon:yes gene_type:complete
MEKNRLGQPASGSSLETTPASVLELQNQVNALSSMKSSALTKAIIRVSSIIPVRGIETLV